MLNTAAYAGKAVKQSIMTVHFPCGYMWKPIICRWFISLVWACACYSVLSAVEMGRPGSPECRLHRDRSNLSFSFPGDSTPHRSFHAHSGRYKVLCGGGCCCLWKGKTGHAVLDDRSGERVTIGCLLSPTSELISVKYRVAGLPSHLRPQQLPPPCWHHIGHQLTTSPPTLRSRRGKRRSFLDGIKGMDLCGMALFGEKGFNKKLILPATPTTVSVCAPSCLNLS